MAMKLLWVVLLIIVCGLVVVRVWRRNREKQRKKKVLITRLRKVMESEKYDQR